MNDLIEKIKSGAHWRVNIRPTVFEPERIATLSKCVEIVNSSRVQLRGWDYPHIEGSQPTSGDDWVECEVDFMSHVEYWRFYQSGQFIHQFACDEEYHPLPWRPAPERYLGIISTLYTLTEVFEFAARLGARGILAPSANISIELTGMKERHLVMWDATRLLFGEYVSKVDHIAMSKTISQSDLLARSTEMALDAAIGVYERFNWLGAPRHILLEDQKKLLERKL